MTLEGPNKSARGTNNTIVGPYGVAFGDSNKVTIRDYLLNMSFSSCIHLNDIFCQACKMFLKYCFIPILCNIGTPCSPPSLISLVVLAEIQTQDHQSQRTLS